MNERADTPTMHTLKSWPEFYTAAAVGTKTFDLRRNDRDFRVGDKVTLKEWQPSAQRYTGRELVRTIAYILRAENTAATIGLKPGYVILGLED